MITTDTPAVRDLIAAHRFRYGAEGHLQEGIAGALAQAGWPVRREVLLNRHDRVDLLVVRVGVEVKVAGKPDSVLRQLQRYAASDLLDELLLVTTRARHRDLPAQVGGKSLTVLLIGGVL